MDGARNSGGLPGPSVGLMSGRVDRRATSQSSSWRLQVVAAWRIELWGGEVGKRTGCRAGDVDPNPRCIHNITTRQSPGC